MLGFFPDPYPGELLYSACARFNVRMRYPSIGTAAHELFGRKNTVAIVDLPGSLDTFVTRLPPTHRYTTDRIIQENSTLPFYAPFISPSRLKSVKKDLCRVSGNHARERLGIAADGIRPPERLRFCPTCVNEDRERYGETYWHRIHQIPGVEVCPNHFNFLESSNALSKDRRAPSKFIPAENVVHNASPVFIDKSQALHSNLLKIAVEVDWLLRQQLVSLGPELLNRRYYNLLLRHGYAYYNGRIRTDSLITDFISFYSAELLDKFQCSIKSTAHSWITRLALIDKAQVAQHPLRHLLLLTFLGYTAEQFLNQFKEYKAFGDGPWPCLNRASGHFRQPLINVSCVTDCSAKKKRGKPLGIFSCTCGFVYTRLGPDTSKEAQYKFNNVQTYGSLWEKTLCELWGNAAISTGEIGRRLGVADLTAVRYAIRLRLPMNTAGSRKVSEKTIRRYSNFRSSREEAIKHHRAEWIAVREMNPLASRKELISIASFLYLWLRKNDTEWIESHSPSPLDKGRKVPRVDWEKLDCELSEAIIRSTIRIKAIQGKPVRASLAEVIREIGHQVHLEQRLDKLPRTSAALYAHIETLEDYAIRRLRWAEACYKQEGVCPTRAKIIRRAVLQATKSVRAPLVQSAIDDAVERLSKRFR